MQHYVMGKAIEGMGHKSRKEYGLNTFCVDLSASLIGEKPPVDGMTTVSWFFFAIFQKVFVGLKSILWGHWYPPFRT